MAAGKWLQFDYGTGQNVAIWQHSKQKHTMETPGIGKRENSAKCVFLLSSSPNLAPLSWSGTSGTLSLSVCLCMCVFVSTEPGQDKFGPATSGVKLLIILSRMQSQASEPTNPDHLLCWPRHPQSSIKILGAYRSKRDDDDDKDYFASK